MNLKTTASALFLGMVCAFTSCSLDDDTYNTTTYDDAAISSITFGNLKKKTTYKNKAGGDSIVYTTFAGSSWKIRVNQLTREIDNINDSLPIGTMLDKVLMTVSTVSSSYPYLLKKDTTVLEQYISSSDTINLDTVRTIRVIATDTQHYNDYKIKLVAHQEAGDSTSWGSMVTVNALAELGSVRAVASKDSVYAIGSTSGNTSVIYCANGGNIASWTKVTLPAELSTSAQLIAEGTSVFVLDPAAPALYMKGANGWETVGANVADIKRIIALHAGKLHAVNADDKIVASSDNGVTWTAEDMDVDGTLLPTTDISQAVYTLTTNTELQRLTVIGNTDADSEYASVWSCLTDTLGNAADKWFYQDWASNNGYKLPKLTSLSATGYGDYILAIGSLDKGSSYECIYSSNDHGITWKKNKLVKMPKDFTTSGRIADFSASIVADSSNMIWIICGGTGNIWRGRLNKMTW